MSETTQFSIEHKNMTKTRWTNIKFIKPKYKGHTESEMNWLHTSFQDLGEHKKAKI